METMEKNKQINLNDLLKQLDQAIKQQNTQISMVNKSSFEPTSNLGKAIKIARADQSLSQKQLAALTGLSTLTIAKLEAGNRRVSFENVEKVLSALGKSFWIK